MKDESNKTEKATPFKLKEAKKKGQVAKSMEVNHAFILLIFVLVGAAFWPRISERFSSFTKTTWLSGNNVKFEIDSLVNWYSSFSSELLIIFGPLLLVILSAGIFSNILQTGPIFSTSSFKIDMNRINPAEGLKKLFSLQKIFELVKSIAKLSLIGCLLYLGALLLLPKLMIVSINSQDLVDDFIVSQMTLVGMCVVLVLVPIVYLDFLFARKQFSKKMKMSQREVKEEHKRQEGNPEIKAKRRQIQKELLKKTSAISKVEEADLIIVNPTHFAVGLKYDRKTMLAPIVIVKGRGELARSIRQLAQRYGKVFYRKPEIARVLYKNCQIDQPIPHDQFSQIADIYRNFYALKEAQ